jgi:hypothetical protein
MDAQNDARQSPDSKRAESQRPDARSVRAFLFAGEESTLLTVHGG